MESEVRNIEQLFKSKEWIAIKTRGIKTDRILSRIEWLKEVGWQNYSEEKYNEYLEIMKFEGESFRG